MKSIFLFIFFLVLINEVISGSVMRDLDDNKLPDMKSVRDSMIPLKRKKGHLQDPYESPTSLENLMDSSTPNTTIITTTEAKPQELEENDPILYYFNWVFALGFLSLAIFFGYVCLTTENRLDNQARYDQAHNIELQTLSAPPSPNLGPEFVNISLDDE